MPPSSNLRALVDSEEREIPSPLSSVGLSLVSPDSRNVSFEIRFGSGFLERCFGFGFGFGFSASYDRDSGIPVTSLAVSPIR